MPRFARNDEYPRHGLPRFVRNDEHPRHGLPRRARNGGFASGRLREQALVGDAQAVMQALDHAQAECTLTVQHFRHAATRANEGLQVTRGQALLLHTEFDGVHGVGGADGVVPVLVGFDHGDKDFHLISSGRTGFGLKHAF